MLWFEVTWRKLAAKFLDSNRVPSTRKTVMAFCLNRYYLFPYRTSPSGHVEQRPSWTASSVARMHMPL